MQCLCYNLVILRTYNNNLGILPEDQEVSDAAMSLEQLSVTSNNQDDTSESSQSDRSRSPLPPKMY